MRNLLFGIVYLIALPTVLFAQKTTAQYIEEYAAMAVREMERSGVPASITLAQGILESGSGNSRLALEGNNHFGIKCHTWNGEKIYADDDAKNECFRKYKSADESFRDHSDFLKTNSRYSFLFEIDKTNYKEWAKGLKKAGYATSPTYAEALINLIEKYELYRYDTQGSLIKPHNNRKKTQSKPAEEHFTLNPYGRHIYYINNVPFIIAGDNESIEKICSEFDMMPWQVRKYNDIEKGDSITTGDRIYLKPKRNKADKEHSTHTVSDGETMYSISQQYGIKLNQLYRKNKMEPGTEPKPNTVLSLRKSIR